MELPKQLNTIIEEVKYEAKNFEAAESKEEEIEALKEMLDALMRGAHQVQEKLDQFNERRYR
jgi:type IV secretory pathway VirB4 component